MNNIFCAYSFLAFPSDYIMGGVEYRNNYLKYSILKASASYDTEAFWHRIHYPQITLSHDKIHSFSGWGVLLRPILRGDFPRLQICRTHGQY